MKRSLVLWSWLACLGATTIAGADVPKVVAKVDEQLRAAWKEHGITPTAQADDARWLRRLSLDLTGHLPPPQAVRDFLADTSVDKRARAIDRLLDSPAYAEHWATYWDNILIGRLTREAYLDRQAFRQWLSEGFEKNRPWNELVRELVVAEGYNSNRETLKGGVMPSDIDDRYNPATNFFLRYSRSLPDFSSVTSRVFLGVQIQCAQCHDHKTEKWTQQDFKQFTACFSKTYATYVDKPAMLTQLVGVFRMDLKDRVFFPPVKKYETYFGSYADYVEVAPKLLDGPAVKTLGSRRKVAADWVTGKDNPWFAQAIVNRLWGRLLGRGFVEPVDDFRPGNPPIMPETLRALSDEFVASGYDLKHLFRAICNSQAYQRACVEDTSAATRHGYWSSFPIKALDVEVLFDAIVDASDAVTAINRVTKNNFPLVRGAFIQQLVSQMGTDDMAEVTEPEETIPRSLMMLNGPLVCGSTRATAGFGLGELLSRQSDDAAVIETLYLRALSRQPSPAERAKWLAFIGQSRKVVHTTGPEDDARATLSATRASEAIAKAPKDADFSELLKQARTAADFTAMRGRMENNADAALLGKAFSDWVAQAPFQYLAGVGGGNTPRQQAFEDMYWALLNSTEFLTNH